MKRIFFSRALLALGIATLVAMPTSHNASAAPSQREFTVVAANSPLHAHLLEIRRAGWTGLLADATEGSTPSGSAGMTRYEMSLETAKAIFTIQARQGANAAWSENARPKSMRALRALCLEFKTELTQLGIQVDAAISLLNRLLKPQVPATTSPAASGAPKTSLNFSPAPTGFLAFPDASEKEISLPLSQRLRVYGALSSLVREKNRFSSGEENTVPQDIFQLKAPQARPEDRDFRVGTTLAITNRLRLRAGLEQKGPESLFTASDHSQAARDPERSIGSGVDFSLMPGVVLSGGVARVKDFDPDATAGGETIDGTRFEGGIGLSGWQNRVALSAHLARLVPEDSPAFGTTAAHLNLGVEVTRQVQLKLLFRQMFETPQNPGGARKISGGININF